MDQMDRLSLLNRFAQDTDSLTPISEWIGKVNIFDVLGISRTEIRHSNMLAWLIDPNENHGLGENVLRGIIQCVSDDIPLDCSGFVVRREWNWIDLLAVSDEEKYVLCIENKIDTGEHDDQLKRYKALVDGTYPGYRKAFAYLTRSGRASSDPENWSSLGYADVLQVIEEAKSQVQLQPEAELLIRNYMDVIRGIRGGDEGIRKKCAAVYMKHSAAIELILKSKYGDPDGESGIPDLQPEEKKRCDEIYRQYKRELELIRKNRPGRGTDPVAETIRTWAAMKTDSGDITFYPDKTSDATLRFTTRVMSGVLPDVPGLRSAWDTENFYFYEVRNTQLPSREHELSIQLAVGSKNMPANQRRICDRINSFYPAPQKKEDWVYRINFTTDHIIFNEDDDREKIMNQLDAFLEEVYCFERELIGKLGE